MKRIFNASFLWILLIVSMFLVNCSKDNPASPNESNSAVEEPFSFEMNVVNHAGFNLEAINGTIVITRVVGANSVMITGNKRVEAESSEEAREHLQDIEISMKDSIDQIFVKTVQPENTSSRNYIVNYTITLPQNFNLTVNSVNGPLTLNDIFGNVFVGLVNGDINSKITLPLDGTIDMATVNGDIDLDIPQNTSAQFSATLVNGNISVSGLDLQNQVLTSRSLSGTCGDGKGTIHLSTTNGSITVTGF
jgi:DUF4097 and DUF4098 domain-containing protein YvlB